MCWRWLRGNLLGVDCPFFWALGVVGAGQVAR